jgi:ATP-binding cassette, sub-family E, member 1
MRLAIVHKEKCRPTVCGHDCSKACPVNKKGEECISIKGKAKIDEKTCVGCTICVKRCPFGAIEIINLPSVDEKNMVFRYGENGFALYGLPVPKEGSVLGLLGRNGIGKTTAVEILSGKEKINLGKEEVDEGDVKEFFKGNELMRYFENLDGKKVSYKPQNLSSLAVNVSVLEVLKKRGKVGDIKKLAVELGVDHVLDNKLNKLSGGELQRVAILAASLGEADVYFFDEPLAFLDISERLRVSDFIKNLGKEGKTIVVVEHDLLILDYLTDYLNIFFGQQSCYGAVSGVKGSKEGVNAYLHGFLKQENLRIRDKELNFNFSKNLASAGKEIASWPDFNLKFDSFSLEALEGKIKENHVIGILGKNGTGKTSFVQALAGLIDVEIDGKKKKLDLDLDVSYKPQYLFTDSEDLIRDVMIKEKISKKIASTFNLEVLNQKKMKNLSGGELQRFNIARCLSKDADVYLIDEPSAYLDVEERIAVAKIIKDIMTEKQKTAFVVDHDLLLVSYLADNVMVFSGESGKSGKAGEIMNFEDGISRLLKELDVTLRKDKDSGRPRINKRGSVLDREQKQKEKYAIF